MKKLIIIAICVSVIASVVVNAADYYYAHFFVFKDSTATNAPLPSPCRLGVKSIAMALDEENVLQLAYLCNDDTTIIRTDMRPGSGTAVGSINQNIKLSLDAVNGGWAYECGHVITSVKVTIDGQSQDFGPNFYRGSRQDVATAFGNTCAEQLSSGIGFQVNTAGLTPGQHQMTMQVVDDIGQRSPVSNMQMVTIR